MIPVQHGNVIRLHSRDTRVSDIVPPGQRLVWRNSSTATEPRGLRNEQNARRDAEYRLRRSGRKPALIQIWRA